MCVCEEVDRKFSPTASDSSNFQITAFATLNMEATSLCRLTINCL